MKLPSRHRDEMAEHIYLLLDAIVKPQRIMIPRLSRGIIILH